MTDYPTEAELEEIRKWEPGIPAFDYRPFMKGVEAVWNHHYGTLSLKERVYRISTGGWSGNEDIIRAMQENSLFGGVCWVSSKRGGHYVFEVPRVTRTSPQAACPR